MYQFHKFNVMSYNLNKLDERKNMPKYESSDTHQKFMDDFKKSNEEYHQGMEEARKILKQDIPPFLALALASRIIGREEAKKLQDTIRKGHSQSS